MNEFKGTPAPWEVIEHNWSDTSIMAGDRTVCSISIYHEGTEETQEQLEDEVSANAKLIASAPDLLEALQHLIKEWDKVTDVFPLMANEEAYIKAKQIVKKALGE